VILCKTVTAICLGATLCTAQTINISGFVKDDAGIGISGATVKLEITGIATTTETDGSFTLTGGVSITKPTLKSSTLGSSPAQIQNGKIVFTISEDAPVAISIHGVGGRQLFNSKRTYGSGTHTITLPMQATGIYLGKVTIGNEGYTIKSLFFGVFSTAQGMVSVGNSALAKQAKATAVIKDVIAVKKEGKLNCRCIIGNADTSGVVIKMVTNAGDVTDADGNVYQSVRIGNQVWIVENLKTTKYSDGTVIPLVTGISAWDTLSTPGRSWYDNDSTLNHATFGVLYNWYAVNTGKLAPEGWRVPTDAEWDTLQNNLIENGYNWDGTTNGNKIAKSLAAQTDWTIYIEYFNTVGAIGTDLGKNNSSGFSALPGGYRANGHFSRQSNYGFWWSATEDSASNAYNRVLSRYYEDIYRGNSPKSLGCAVRLVRDN